MIELSFHDMIWCPSGGHPVLVLEAKGKQLCFAVSVSAEDAQALSVSPHGNGATRVRSLSMLAEVIDRLGAHIDRVTLAFGPDRVLCAELSIAADTNRLDLSSHFADGLILARHASVPLCMTEETFADVDVAAILPTPPTPIQPRKDQRKQGIAEPFRALIDSLDLSDFPRPVGQEGEHGSAD